MTKLKKSVWAILLACIMFIPNIVSPMVAWASAFYEPSKVKDYVFSSGSTWVTATSYTKPTAPKPEDYVTEDYEDGTQNPEYIEANEKYQKDLENYEKRFQQYAYAQSGSTGNLVYSFIDVSSAEWAKTDGAYSTEILNKYGLSAYADSINLDPMQDTTNQKYLLLNAVNYESMFSYKTNSTFTMDANSYYHISFVVKTLGEDTDAYVGISNELEHVVKVNTGGEWVKYDLYIATQSASSSKVNLQVSLGNFTDDTEAGYSAGAVLFSTAQVYKISYYDFAEANHNKTATTSFFYNSSMNKLNNPDFDDQSDFDVWSEDVANTNWALWYDENISESSKKNYSATIVEESTEEALMVEKTEGEGEDATTEKVGYATFPTSNNFGEKVTNNILKLTNNGKAMEMALRSAPITILQQAFYKITVYAKATEKDAQLKIRAYTEIALGGKPNKEFVKEITSSPYTSSSTDILNGWQEYTIYVQGHSLYNKDIYLDLFAGSKSTIYIDHISVQRVDYNAYNKANNKLDLAPSDLVGGDKIISNASFNWASTEGIQQENVAYPLPAKSWSNVASDKEEYKDFAVTSGIIPTDNTLSFVDASNNTYDAPIQAEDIYQSAALKGLLNGANSGIRQIPVFRKGLNVYMMSTYDADNGTYNKTQYFTRTSSTFTLSSSKVYAVTFQVYVTENTENVTCSVLFGDAIMSTINISGTATPNTWQTYTFYVQTDSSSKSIKLQFGFGDTVLDTAGKGTFFVADFRTQTIDKTNDKTTDELFAEKADVAIDEQQRQHYACLDFKYENWTMIASNPDNNANKGLYTINNYKTHEDSTTDNENIHVGVLDTSRNDYADITFSGINANDVSVAEGATHQNVLVINHEEAGYTYLQPSVTKTLSSNNYYKISIRVKTTELTGGKFTVSIPKLNFAWTDIDTTTSTEVDANGYVTYTLLVRTGTSSVTSLGIELKLGTKDNQTKGSVFVSDYTTTTLTKADYNKALEELDFTKSNVKSIDLSTNVSNSNLNDTDTATILFVVFSSILLVAALVIALVGSGIKKLPKHNTLQVTNKYNPKQPNANGADNDTKPDSGIV